MSDVASADGAYGSYWPVFSADAVAKLKTQSGVPSSAIVVLSGELFTPANIAALEKVSKVKGVIVATIGLPEEAYSETEAFPQASTNTGGEPASFVWNSAAHNLVNREYKWPVWSVPSGDELNEIISQANSNLKSKTRFGAQMTQFSYAYKNPETCLRYGFCEPVGGHTVWGVLPPPSPQRPTSSWPNTRFVMTLSRLDSISLFPGQAIGAVADMSGLVANLAAMTALSGIDNLDGAPPSGTKFRVDPSKFKNPILWAFFDAEHWGYAGSTRFLNDWTKFECIGGPCKTAKPFIDDFKRLRIENIKSIFELRQVGAKQIVDGTKQLFVHQVSHPSDSTISELVRQAGFGLNTSVSKVAGAGHGLPPSSSFTFLSAAQNPSNPAANALVDKIVVISDHKTTYNNAYYGSRYDLASNVDVDMVTDAATLLARSLYASAMEVSGNEANQLGISVNRSIVQAWLQCTTVNANCPLSRALIPDHIDKDYILPSHYHGPIFDWAISMLGKLTHDYMLAITRDQSQDRFLKKCSKSEDCSFPVNCVLGKCLNTSYVQYHDAYSLGIKRKTAGGWEVVDSKFENWVEP